MSAPEPAASPPHFRRTNGQGPHSRGERPRLGGRLAADATAPAAPAAAAAGRPAISGRDRRRGRHPRRYRRQGDDRARRSGHDDRARAQRHQHAARDQRQPARDPSLAIQPEFDKSAQADVHAGGDASRARKCPRRRSRTSRPSSAARSARSISRRSPMFFQQFSAMRRAVAPAAVDRHPRPRAREEMKKKGIDF